MLAVTLNTTNSRWIEYLSMNAFIRVERDYGKLLMFTLVVGIEGADGKSLCSIIHPCIVSLIS